DRDRPAGVYRWIVVNEEDLAVLAEVGSVVAVGHAKTDGEGELVRRDVRPTLHDDARGRRREVRGGGEGGHHRREIERADDGGRPARRRPAGVEPHPARAGPPPAGRLRRRLDTDAELERPRERARPPAVGGP